MRFQKKLVTDADLELEDSDFSFFNGYNAFKFYFCMLSIELDSLNIKK